MKEILRKRFGLQKMVKNLRFGIHYFSYIEFYHYQFYQIWSGILIKHPKEDDEDFYNDDELDYGYESEAMIIEPDEYIRFPLPKGNFFNRHLKFMHFEF